jgi:FHA domain-containing protein
MTEVSYVPGEWTAIAGDRCWALIDAAPDSAAVRELWQRIEGDAGLDALLASLLGMGLREVPGFALLAARDGGGHLICRGRGSATLISGGTTERLAGTGLVTWREHPVPPDARCVVLGDPPAGTDLRLPASMGVFLAQSVTIALVAAGHGRHEAAPPARAAIPDATGSRAETPAPAAPSRPAGDVGATLTYPAAQDWIPGSDAAAPAPDGTGPAAGSGPAEDTGYDFLFGATQARTVEDAAVRPAADDGEPSGLPQARLLPASAAPQPQAPPVPRPEPRGAPAGPAAIEDTGTPAGPGGLIDAVPWASGPDEPSPGGALPAAPRPPLAPVPQPPPVAAAPPSPARPAVAPPGPAADPDGDNGATVRREDLLRLASLAASSDRIGPTVHAVLCPSSHPSPPSSPACRVCGVPLPEQDPVTVPRPVLGVLRLSTGDVITLDRGVVMGRSPRTDFDGEERPHIVKLPSGDGDISRTHLQVSLDGWHVLVADLKSTNGTLVTLPGRDPERLRPGEPVPIQPGTVVTLSDDIHFRYEAAQ